jgi:hypothetical protein
MGAMSTHVTAKFTIKDWDEKTYAEFEDGGKLTKATVKQALAGDIEGEATVEWLMCYRPDQTADFVGLQRISGRIGERAGSLVVAQTDGTFDGKEARGALSVVPGSASGDLQGLRGSGEFRAPHGGEASISLDYELD